MAIAFYYEMIDSSLGMGYGTLLTPTLFLLGYPISQVIPAVIITQAIGGLVASFFHSKYKNVSYTTSRDAKVVLVIISMGIVMSILGALTSVSIPKYVLSIYIGVMVLCMGLLILIGVITQFAWWKVFVIGIIGSFNKGLSGGGFGPIITGGQILNSGRHKSSVGITTLAEVPICVTGFIVFALSGFLLKTNWFDLMLYGGLAISAILGGAVGPLITKRLAPSRLQMWIGWLMVVLGFGVLIKLFL
jgi:uncharacterized membrane protein YfcA